MSFVWLFLVTSKRQLCFSSHSNFMILAFVDDDYPAAAAVALRDFAPLRSLDPVDCNVLL